VTHDSFTIDEMNAADWPAVKRIYEDGIASGVATFETEAPSWERWDTSHRPDHRLVARAGAEVLGWAALSPYSVRSAYAGVAEVSVYVAEAHRAKGVGRALLERLVADTEAAGIWTLQAGVFPANEPSLALHRSLGFRVVGVRERIGKLAGQWSDVVLLERRSESVGLD
jgi:L-amino acid N-acyltransferase YncA